MRDTQEGGGPHGRRAITRALALASALLTLSGTWLGASPPPSEPIPSVVVVGRGNPIVIGYWLVVEGPDASLGIDSLRGIEIAIDDRNKSLLGRPIRLVGENEGCNANDGGRAATRLAENRQLIAAIGSSCSSGAVPGAPILWRARIPTVSPSNTSARLTDPSRGAEYSGYLRTSPNEVFQARTAARFAYNVLRLRRAATIHDGSPYAENLQNEFTRGFRQMGGTIVAQEAIAPSDVDMAPVLARIAQHTPDLIYFPISVSAGSIITRQSRSTAGLEHARLMVADAMMSPNFLRAAGPAAAGVFLTSPDFSPDVLGPEYQTFLVKYIRKYGTPSSVFNVYAYDAAAMIFAAIQKVARRSASGDLVVDRVAVRNTLYATRDFRGITGKLTCNRFGDCAVPRTAIYQVTSTDPANWKPGVSPKKVFP